MIKCRWGHRGGSHAGASVLMGRGRGQVLSLSPRCEDTVRRWLGPHRTLDLGIRWPWTSSLQNQEKTVFAVYPPQSMVFRYSSQNSLTICWCMAEIVRKANPQVTQYKTRQILESQSTRQADLPFISPERPLGWGRACLALEADRILSSRAWWAGGREPRPCMQVGLQRIYRQDSRTNHLYPPAQGSDKGTNFCVLAKCKKKNVY